MWSERMSLSLPALQLISTFVFHQFCPLVPVFDVLLYKSYKPRTQSLCSQNCHKMTQHSELFFSLNICPTFGSLPEENDTSSISIKWPHMTEPITALEFPHCNHRISDLKRTHCSLHSCWASFLGHELTVPTSFVCSSIHDAAAVRDIQVSWGLGLQKFETSNNTAALTSRIL